MGLRTRYELNEIASLAIDEDCSSLIPTANGWFIRLIRQAAAIEVDEHLNERRRICFDLNVDKPREVTLSRLPGLEHSHHFRLNTYEPWTLTESADSSLLALTTAAGILLTDRNGKTRLRIGQTPWRDSSGTNCFFDVFNRLWYVRPGDAKVEPPSLVVLDSETGRPLHEAIIQKAWFGSYELIPLSASAAMICISGALDASIMQVARLTATGLVIDNIAPHAAYFDGEYFLGGISPGNDEFLLATDYPSALRIRSLHNGTLRASLDHEAIFADEWLFPSVGENDDCLEAHAAYLGDDRILALTRWGRLVLIDRKRMEVMGTVWPPEYEIDRCDQRGLTTLEESKTVDFIGDLTWFMPVDANRLLTRHQSSFRLLDALTLVS